MILKNLNFQHIPVLFNESIENLNIKPGGIYVDGTLGGAGHSFEIARRMMPEGTLIGIDQDINAIETSKHKLKEYGDNVIIVHDNFKNIKNAVFDSGISQVDGILLDLGVSSHQLDEEERGFSYMKDALLDMRMNRENSLTAEYIVNNYSFLEIKRIIKEYGEEKWADRIAKFICEDREKNLIKSTLQLVDIIKRAIPAAARREGPHPAKRTFQALRIEVNNELGILESTIEDSVSILKPGGRLCIITFHSLEDRIVKSTFARLEHPCTCPPKMPICVCGKEKQLKVISRKPIVADENELEDNPRSRSAKLRVAEKLSSKIG